MSDLPELKPPRDLSHHYSRVTKKRQPSAIKRFYKYFFIPGIGNLAGGLPNPGYFPYDTLEARVATPDRFKPTPNKPVIPPSGSVKPKASHITVPHDSAETNVLRKLDLATALQYGTAQGFPPLWTWVKDFALNTLHPHIPYLGGADVILTCGSTDGFSKCIECFVNVWDEDRDWLRDREGILCEEFAYGLGLTAARPKGVNVVSVKMDDEGMLAYGPGGLQDVLENWDRSKGKRPHLMYTITMGQNPTSGLLSVTRRKQIYALCSKYDIIIIEDDPYWYLQYPSANQMSIESRGKPISPNYAADAQYRPVKSSGYAFLDSLVPSYLSIDTDGRVCRLDTFSKTVAPGCRLGWITAQPEMIERILRITESSTQQPSGFVQSLIGELIIGQAAANTTKSKDEEGWQMDGWVRWLEGLRGNYERRMGTMSQILDNGKFTVMGRRRRDSILSSSSHDFEVVRKVQLYEFQYPMAGMFLWVRVLFENHPLNDSYDHEKLAQALWLFMTTPKYRVLVSPGTMFSSSDKIRQEEGWKYFRLCFAAVDDDQVAKISQDFVAATNDFFEIDDPKIIDKLLEDEDKEDVDGRLGQLALDASDKWFLNPAIC